MTVANPLIIERRTRNPEETMDLAAACARCLVDGDVLALDGALGAGKTCFVRGLARGIGLDPRVVSSPTFVICRQHQADDGRVLAHLDAYRLKDDADLDTIGWDELIEQGDAIVAVEWPGRMTASRFPSRTIRIEIDTIGADERLLRFAFPGSIADRFDSIRPRTRPCRTCGKPISSDDATFPFCSERCRLADLHAWFEERHRVSRPIEDGDQG